MRILVLGASQGTGARAVENALARGHAVTAFARHPHKLTLTHTRLTRVAGNFHARADVAAVVPGHDAVIITASTTRLGDFKANPAYFSEGTGYAVEAMEASGVRRLVVLSALGTGDSRPLVSWLVDKLAISWLLKLPFADHERQEELVRRSGLEWVIARPGRLTNGPARRRYTVEVALARVPFAIARADLADFLVEAAVTDRWIRQAVQIGG